MDSQGAIRSLSILLSQEEVLAVLDLLAARELAGMEPNPLDALPPDQQQLVLAVARRALRARGLAQRGDDGRLLLHRSLLAAVGACAYSESAVAVYHWPPDRAEPTMLFGYLRGDDVVAHSYPDPVLHHFALLSSAEELIVKVVLACALDGERESGLALVMTRDLFAAARERAGSDREADVAALLTANGNGEEAAAAFARTMCAAPRVSLIRLARGVADGATRVEQLTLIQGDGHLWAIASTAADESSEFQARSTTIDSVCEWLGQWLKQGASRHQEGLSAHRDEVSGG